MTGKNEHTPAWGSASLDGTGSLLGVAVSEDAVVGTTVTTLVADDDDQGLDGQVSFELVSVTSGTNTSLHTSYRAVVDSAITIAVIE